MDFSQIDVDLDAYRNALKDPELREDAWYAFIIRTASKPEANEKSGNWVLKYQVNPLKDDQDSSSIDTRFKLRNQLILPLPNPQHDGHEVTPVMLRMFEEQVRALGFETITTKPFWSKTLQQRAIGTYDEPVPVTEAEEEEIKQNRAVQIRDTAVTVGNDPQCLVGRVFYAKVKKNGEFTNLQYMRSELPSDAILLDPDEWLA